MFNLGALAGLSSVGKGYDEAQATEADTALKKQRYGITGTEFQQGQEGLNLAGNALRLLFQPSGTQGPPGPSPGPGSASLPPGAPPMAGATGMGQTPGAMAPTGFPGGPGGQMSGAMPGSMPGNVPPQLPMGGGTPPMGPGGFPPSPASRPMGGPSGVQPPGGPGQPPTMSLQTILQAVVKANPGASPRALMQAVDHLIPLMRADEQALWRQESLRLRQLETERKTEHDRDVSQRGYAQMNLREKLPDIIAQHRQELQKIIGTQAMERLDKSLTSKEGIAAEHEAAATERTEKTVAGAKERTEAVDKRAQATREQREKQFQQREARLDRQSVLRHDEQHERLEQQKKSLEARITQAGDRQALSQWRAVVDAQHKRAMETINASGLIANQKDRQRLLEEQRAFYDAEIKRMKSGGQSQAPAGGGDTPPVSALKEGMVTTFENGQKWTLKGGKPERVP